MRRMRAACLRLLGAFVRRRREHDLTAELESHLQMHIEDSLRAGMTPAEARRQALLALGGVEQTKEQVRDARATFLDSIRQDVVFALRLMRRSPVVTCVAVLSLALGIGANTAIFSILDSLLLRSLPVREPDRLAFVATRDGISNVTNPVWEQIRHRGHLFDGVGAWSTTRFNLAERGETDFVDGLLASGRFLDVLGVPAILGRGFQETDDRRDGSAAVAVISYAFWQRRYGGAADVIGRSLTLDRVPFTVIGVTPPRFLGPDVGRAFDVAVPIAADLLIRGRDNRLDRRSSFWLNAVLRLERHQTLESAARTLRGVQPQIREATLPDEWRPSDLTRYLKDPFVLVGAAAGRSTLRSNYRDPLVTIMLIAAVVLLIACANIVNLFLARATARRHEMSVRRALGASRLRLARLFIVESLLLSGLGTLIGIVVAIWGSELLVRQVSTMTSRITLDLSVDWRVLGFTAAVAVATALLSGMVPAFRASRVPACEAVNEQGRGSGRHTRAGVASLLVAGQVALSLVLVVAAALFVRTFSTLASRNLGFEPSRVLVVDTNARRSAVAPANRLDLYDRVRRAVIETPGVARATSSLVIPVSQSNWAMAVQVPGGPELSEDQRRAHIHVVGPGSFSTLGTPILAGREFTDRDRLDAPLVAIVNEAFVARHQLGRHPIGRTVRWGYPAPGPPMEIVGVAKDAVYASLREVIPPTLYLPLNQQTKWVVSAFSLFVQARSGSPMSLVRQIAATIGAVDRDLVLTFRPLSKYVDDSLSVERLLAMLSGFFGVLALLLTALGLFGVTAYAVNRRRAEIGIRMALGAAPAGVVRMVLGRVAWLVGLGVVIGAGVSLWAARFVESLLFGVKARDPLTFAGAAAVLAATALVAGWLPARRAARVDPTTVLREI